MKLLPIRHRPHLYKHDKTGIIYFRKFRKGFNGNKEIFKSTGTSNLGKAILVAQEFDAIHFGEKKAKNIRKLFEDEWPEYLKNQKTKAPATYSSMEVQGRLHLMPFFSDKFLHEINEDLWEQYIAESFTKTPGRKLFNDRKYLSMFLNHLYRVQKITRVPKLRDPDPERAAGKVYSDDEIARLKANAADDLRLQIEMAVTMGMRLSEILFLSWDRVDLKNKTIHLRAEDTKIRKARTFGISESVFTLLKARSEATDSPHVFPSPTNKERHVGRGGNKSAWRACKKRAKVKGRFHWLRHTFLTRAFKNSVNPALICNYAGLSLEEAERTYLHFTVEDTRIVSSLVSYKS